MNESFLWSVFLCARNIHLKLSRDNFVLSNKSPCSFCLPWSNSSVYSFFHRLWKTYLLHLSVPLPSNHQQHASSLFSFLLCNPNFQETSLLRHGSQSAQSQSQTRLSLTSLCYESHFETHHMFTCNQGCVSRNVSLLLRTLVLPLSSVF